MYVVFIKVKFENPLGLSPQTQTTALNDTNSLLHKMLPTIEECPDEECLWWVLLDDFEIELGESAEPYIARFKKQNFKLLE